MEGRYTEGTLAVIMVMIYLEILLPPVWWVWKNPKESGMNFQHVYKVIKVFQLSTLMLLGEFCQNSILNDHSLLNFTQKMSWFIYSQFHESITSFYSILLFYLYFLVTTTTTTTTTTPSPSSSSGCFPSESRVKLENGKSATMSELQIGDKIQTGTH